MSFRSSDEDEPTFLTTSGKNDATLRPFEMSCCRDHGKRQKGMPVDVRGDLGASSKPKSAESGEREERTDCNECFHARDLVPLVGAIEEATDACRAVDAIQEVFPAVGKRVVPCGLLYTRQDKAIPASMSRQHQSSRAEQRREDGVRTSSP